MFSCFWEDGDNVGSCAKNCRAVYFKPGYVNADGDITNYCPDILMNLSDRRNCILGSKGLAALNVPFNMQWLRSWYNHQSSTGRYGLFPSMGGHQPGAGDPSTALPAIWECSVYPPFSLIQPRSSGGIGGPMQSKSRQFWQGASASSSPLASRLISIFPSFFLGDSGYSLRQ